MVWEEATFSRVRERERELVEERKVGRGAKGGNEKDGGEERRREEMIEEAPCIRLLVSGAATYDFIGCLPLHRLDESKI